MKGRPSAVPKTHDEYLASVPSDMRAALQSLRKTIRSAAPDAEEVISYRMPAFRHHGILVYYAAFRDHCSLFVGGETRGTFAAELKPFAGGKGTIQFTPQRPLPASLVRRIVKERVAVNEARVAARRARGARRGKKTR
jgi:uncharacterized protein YdhG (YjbR/CyaY superfamily)